MSEKIKLYRPANGTEGDCFYAAWCASCEHERKMREDPDFGDGCQILGATFMFDVTDDSYPKEWRYGDDGRAMCTAYLAERDDNPAVPRCTKTVDMFGDPK